MASRTREGMFLRGAELLVDKSDGNRGGGGVDGFGAVGSPNDKRPFNRRPSRPRSRPCI